MLYFSNMSVGITKSQEKSHTKRKNSNHEHSTTKRNKSSTAVTPGKYFEIHIINFILYLYFKLFHVYKVHYCFIFILKYSNVTVSH